MNIKQIATRFLLPTVLVSAYYYVKYGCLVSPRAEVELSSLLRIGRKTDVSSFTKIKASYGHVHIGRECFIATGCFIGGHSGGIEIGDHCLISPNVTIIGNNYRYESLNVAYPRQGIVSKGVRIGSYVWIGAGAVISDGARIGDNVIVTPNTVVSGRVPDNAIVQGNPAKTLFTRR